MKTRSKKANAIVLGGEPRADLLPPEVHQKAKARSTRRILGLLVIFALAVVAGGYSAGVVWATQAQTGLVAAQDRTQVLLTEKLTYLEATTIANLLTTVTSARQFGASTEILWDALFDQITSYLPEGVTLVSGTMIGRAPWESEPAPAGPLRSPRVATLNLVVMSSSLPDETTLVRRLAQLPGFADATPDSVAQADGVFTTTITLNVNEDALSGRFPATGTEASK